MLRFVEWIKALEFAGYRRFVAHWRAIILLLILALATFLIAHADFFGLSLFALLLFFIASQLFWIGRTLDVAERLISGKPRRARLAIVAGLLYSFLFLYSYPEWGLGHVIRAADYRPQSILIYAIFWWWFVGSMLAFLFVTAFGAADRAACGALWLYRKARMARHQDSTAADAHAALLSPSRRCFLERTAMLASATPFVAAGYGLLYERQNVEIVRQSVRLARLPKALEGFHIVQLSDIHIGPFTTADYIRRCVAITNGLQPDLIALTGTTFVGTRKPRTRWLVCWRACERLTASSDALETTRRMSRLKRPSRTCLPPTESASSAKSAHLSGFKTTCLI